jgi:hypothetical protein
MRAIKIRGMAREINDSLKRGMLFSYLTQQSVANIFIAETKGLLQEAPMKIISAVLAVFSVCVLMASCSHPTTPPPGNNPSAFPFTLDAKVDGSSFNAGTSMTVSQIASNYYVDVKSTASGDRSMELLFIFPTNSSFPANISQAHFTGTYSEGSNVTWSTSADSVGSATVSVNSFTYPAADTDFTAGFSFKAWGGAGTLTMKDITLGTISTNP